MIGQSGPQEIVRSNKNRRRVLLKSDALQNSILHRLLANKRNLTPPNQVHCLLLQQLFRAQPLV